MQSQAVEEVELGVFAEPPGAGPQRPVPGVVLIHDVWGVSEHTRDLVARLAGEGFAVLAVDLYRRDPPSEIPDAGAWMRSLSDPQAIDDVAACARWLSARPSTAGCGVGVVGFCMGGSYALLAACEVEELGAAVPFYGILSHQHGLLHDPAGLDPRKKPTEPLAAAERLGCPLLAFFGGRDPFVPEADVRELEARLARSGEESEVVLYADAGHAFMNDTRPDAYREREAREAWERCVAFLRERLSP